MFVLAVFASILFMACSHTETYAEKLEKEKKTIAAFIADQGIEVISQSVFYAQDSTTDLSRNEFVQLASGVYMQIVDKGSDRLEDTIRNNENVLVRFAEYNLKDSVYITLSNLDLATAVDEFRYFITSSSIMGIFTTGYMYSNYGTSVPAGWLVPLQYVRDKAHVRLIVPAKMGHETAMSYVYPYYYEIRKYQFDR